MHAEVVGDERFLAGDAGPQAKAGPAVGNDAGQLRRPARLRSGRAQAQLGGAGHHSEHGRHGESQAQQRRRPWRTGRRVSAGRRVNAGDIPRSSAAIPGEPAGNAVSACASTSFRMSAMGHSIVGADRDPRRNEACALRAVRGARVALLTCA